MINLQDELAKLIEEKTRMIEYLRLKTEKGDWHGVADAAMDLREVDAKLDLTRDFINDADN